MTSSSRESTLTRHQSESERRAQILRAARAVFIEKGYLVARVEDVARRAGLSKGAVYFYFPSKQALFMALVREEHENTYSFLQQAEDDPRPAVVKLLDLGQKYLEYFAGLKSPPRFFIMMVEQAIRDDELREEVVALHNRFTDATTRIIAQGIAEGSFRATDPVAAAQLLKALIDGLAGEAAIGMRPDKERLQTDGIRILMEGLMVHPGAAPAPPPDPAPGRLAQLRERMKS